MHHIYTYHIVRHWAALITHTRANQALIVKTWVVPASQCIHIAALCVLFSCAVMISLRLLGIGSRGRSIAEMASTLIPWEYRALVVLLLTGSLQTFIEPVRQFVAPVFWYKMAMICIALTLTIAFSAAVRKSAQRWDQSQQTPLGAKAFAVATILLWGAIIACGRFIGYTYIYHV